MVAEPETSINVIAKAAEVVSLQNNLSRQTHCYIFPTETRYSTDVENNAKQSKPAEKGTIDTNRAIRPQLGREEEPCDLSLFEDARKNVSNTSQDEEVLSMNNTEPDNVAHLPHRTTAVGT